MGISHLVNVKISIRNELDQMDLTFIEFDAESISDKYSWQECDFPDIDVVPGDTYYIVWYPVAFDIDNTFIWGFAQDNQYPDGCAWKGYCVKWEELVIDGYPDPDFCFKTYHSKSKSKLIDSPFSNFIESYPLLYQLIQRFFNF